MVHIVNELPEVYPLPYITPAKLREDRVIQVRVPGSKSITNRALLLAALTHGESVLSGVLFSDDSRHFLACLVALGFQVTIDEEKREVRVRGEGGRIPKDKAAVYVGSAGTAARFLAAFLGLSKGEYEMDASEQMRKRPMDALFLVLEELGCEIRYAQEKGRLPVTLRGNGFGKDDVTVDIEKSSQFLSALLMASSLCERDFTLRLTGNHGLSYVKMTCAMMAQFGGAVIQDGTVFKISKELSYCARPYDIEPDVSAAGYFYAMSPLLGVAVEVEGVWMDSLQGDVAFLKILEQMGCTITKGCLGVRLLPPRKGAFVGICADLSEFSDQAITLAAIAPFAKGETTITGIGHIRYQECDRFAAIIQELNRVGIRTQSTNDSITIFPGEVHPALIETYEDHRMAMGFSLLGLRVPGMMMKNPACCAKTFEDYFTVLERVCGEF
ncbi:MAG: 3-phosphoshikimate 1-carboxyvinyltransferase [Clostridium sp.]|nr:3-phosphoshikimate 1-carboxyvinyltransferase [Clostridium sp.]